MGAVALYLGLVSSPTFEVCLSDVNRFRHYQNGINPALATIEARTEWVRLQQAYRPHTEWYFWQERLEELDHYERCWRELSSALFHPSEKNLDDLRRAIGDRNYAAGQMPGPPP